MWECVAAEIRSVEFLLSFRLANLAYSELGVFVGESEKQSVRKIISFSIPVGATLVRVEALGPMPDAFIVLQIARVFGISPSFRCKLTTLFPDE